jgi:hypothetical protein
MAADRVDQRSGENPTLSAGPARPPKFRFAIDSPLEETVSSELVSEVEIPCYPGKYREFHINPGPRSAQSRPKLPPISVP